jgi:hypothetical protein
LFNFHPFVCSRIQHQPRNRGAITAAGVAVVLIDITAGQETLAVEMLPRIAQQAAQAR